jgi:hypothetical protein
MRRYALRGNKRERIEDLLPGREGRSASPRESRLIFGDSL